MINTFEARIKFLVDSKKYVIKELKAMLKNPDDIKLFKITQVVEVIKEVI